MILNSRHFALLDKPHDKWGITIYYLGNTTESIMLMCCLGNEL